MSTIQTYDKTYDTRRRRWWTRLAGVTLAAALLTGGAASADPWNDRSTLTFSSAVMVPGATLEPGSYVFRLADLRANRHTVKILNEDESRVITIVHAIPVKRQEAEGTTTLIFGATEAGTPPALKAWYYPGTTYGHEFIYSADEARQIAAREKTIVLSEDAASGDADAQGKLRLYDADGSTRQWQADEAVIREWRDWSAKDAAAKAGTVTQTATTDERLEATAPMMNADQRAMRVSVDDLEDDAMRFTGKTVLVSGEVEKVLGPRLFTIDEPHWADLDGEVLVHMPTALATLVRPDDLVSVTGTIRPFVQADVEEEWSWFSDNEDVAVRFKERPVLVATRIIGGDDNRALFIERPAGERTAQADAGTSATSPARTGDRAAASDYTPIERLSKITPEVIGRTVNLDGVQVDKVIPGRGFLVQAEGQSVFVRRADGQALKVKAGDSVSVDGVVLTMPPAMRYGIEDMPAAAGHVYVYATDVS